MDEVSVEVDFMKSVKWLWRNRWIVAVILMVLMYAHIYILASAIGANAKTMNNLYENNKERIGALEADFCSHTHSWGKLIIRKEEADVTSAER